MNDRGTRRDQNDQITSSSLGFTHTQPTWTWWQVMTGPMLHPGLAMQKAYAWGHTTFGRYIPESKETSDSEEATWEFRWLIGGIPAGLSLAASIFTLAI